MNDYNDQENEIIDSSEEPEVEPEVNQDNSEESEVEPEVNQEVIDYTDLLESIDSRLATLESIDYSEQIQACSDNGYRLYYFIGGLYVVFFIILAIKFFKQFF